MATAVEDSWVVVDKTSGGSLRAKASQESLYLSDSDEGAAKPRVHVKAGKAQRDSSDALAPELLEWISNTANESSTALPLANRNSSVSKSSYRTNSSSAGSRQRRTPRRSSVHATSEVSSLLNRASSHVEFNAFEQFNEGLFVVKVLEVRQTGATKPMNLQCVAQVADERFVIPPVMSKPKNYNTWSSKMDDTFVFDVSRQFTFNLGVYGTHPHQSRNRASQITSRVSMASRRHLGRSLIGINNDSNPSLMSNSSTRTSAKIKAGFRKIFRNKNGSESPANDPTYTGMPSPAAPATPVAGLSSAALNEDPRLVIDNDEIQKEETTDEMGRSIEVQRHTASLANSIADFAAMHAGGSSTSLNPQDNLPQAPLQHPALARLSTYLPRSRSGTTTSAHEINYNGPRLRAFSNASTISSTPQPLGELYLDFKVDRREKRRATFTLPVVNQDQVVMRGGSHVEMTVVLEYGIIVHETWEERMHRMQREQQMEEADKKIQAQQLAEQKWAEVDEQDKVPRMRGYLSVFTRSGRLSTWKRYWSVLSCARVLFYESEADEKKGLQPVAKISLIHLYDAGIPESDLVNIGPTGIELRLSPLSMTDRHRRKSAFPRKSLADPDAQQRLIREAANEAMPIRAMQNLSLGPKHPSLDDMDRTLTSAPPGLNEPPTVTDEDDATLYKYSDWQCRVYLLLDTLADRNQWLQELKTQTVPSAEFARFRAKQRKMWKTAQFESATESLRQSGKKLQVVAAQALEKMSSAHNANAKKMFVDSIGLRVVSTSAVGGKAPMDEAELSGATLTNNSGAFALGPKKKPSATTGDVGGRKPVVMAFGKPATFSLSVVPSTNNTMVTSGQTAAQLPAKKRLRARRRSSSVANLRQSFDTNTTLGQSSDEDDKPMVCGSKNRRESSESTMMVEVVGKAMERRPGTVSRRFLFVWNVNDI
ncbi:hypothetical protein GGI07_004699 [Coemansia sp. Benny D115]|nr:hypothetical protein GGI07_004699 [Coemansia sp. Benny D115]